MMHEVHKVYLPFLALGSIAAPPIIFLSNCDHHLLVHSSANNHWSISHYKTTLLSIFCYFMLWAHYEIK